MGQFLLFKCNRMFHCVAVASCLLIFTAIAAAVPFDAVILLDESGSMRQTDPDDRRVSAAEMFVRLCGSDHRVSLMGFSTGVRVLNELAGMGPGNNRQAMVENLQRVRSDGQWTHIERGLRLALDELQREKGPVERRAILLMTDGKVDLGRGRTADRASVQAIRGPLVSECLQEGVEIYCVAFSSGADLALLQYIASATGGMCVQGTRQDELQKMFLRLFEEMAEPQTIPVREGQVLIDSAVREATFLIVHDGASDNVRLNRPDGESITAQSADSNTPWFASDQFDLVTITRPIQGKWEIVPKGEDGDHRVMVLTDLELQIENFPSAMKPGADFKLLASLVSEGQTVTAPEILSRLVMEGHLSGKEKLGFRLVDDGKHMDRAARDGWYGVQFAGPSSPGMYDIEIIARAPTLERRIVRHVAIVDQWFNAEIGRETVRQGQVVPLKVWILDRELAAQSGVKIAFEATIMRPDGIRRIVPVDPISQTLYTSGMGDTKETGVYQITVTGTMEPPGGAPVRHTAGPYRFHVIDDAEVALATPAPAQTPQAQPTPQPSPTPEEHHTPELTPTPETTPAAAQHADSGEKAGGLLTGILSLIFGVVLLAGGIFGFIKYKQSAEPASPQQPSMEHLRQRANEIRNEEYETASMPTVLDETSELQESPENPAPEPEEQAAPDQEAQEEELPDGPLRETPPEGEDVEIIPEAEPGSPESLSAESVASLLNENEEEEEPKEDVSLSDTEAELLDQIMNETSEPQTEAPEAPEEDNQGELSDEQNDLLAEIMNESEESEIPQDTASDLLASLGEESDGENASTVQDSPEESSNEGELSAAKDDLLAEIMAETDNTAEAEPQDEAPAQSEEDLLAEIMAETQQDSGETDSTDTPVIPDESDDKSEQEVIDDILKDIEGMV